MTTMTNSYDEKILSFDVAEGYKAFMAMFDEDEIAEMRKWLERECECTYDYSYNDEDEANDLVIADYVKEMLIANVREDIISGSRQLFNIVYDVL